MDALLQVRGLAVTLPGSPEGTKVLGDVALDLRAGEIVDLIGPSGAGKTTLLRALARLLPGVTGSLMLAGEPAGSIEAEEWRARVTLVPQLPLMWPGTVADNLTLPWRMKVRAAEDPPPADVLRAALGDVGLGDVALTRDAARLSVGQQARISLLRAAVAAPSVLLLDEPDANLDDAAAETVAAYVARFAADGGAVLRVRHLPRGGGHARRLRLEGGHLHEVAEAPVHARSGEVSDA